LKYICLYSPSSVQKIIDFVKTIISFKDYIPVIIKPVGAGAQIGVPEAYRYVYKAGRQLIILPDIDDLKTTLRVNEVYYIDPRGQRIDVKELKNKDNIAIVINSGEGEPGKKELEGVKIVFINELPEELPAISLTSIIIYMLEKQL